MAMRMDETVSGVKADLAVKIFGDDFRDARRDSASRCCARCRRVQGAADAQMEITSGVAELSVHVDRDALARYGLNVSDVEEAVAAGASGDVDLGGDRRAEALHRRAAAARALSDGCRRHAAHPAARACRRTGRAGPGGAMSP